MHSFSFTVDEWASQAASGNGAVASCFHVAHHGRAVPELRRSASHMTRIQFWLLLATATALFCSGCQTAAPGFRSLRDSEITLHEPTGLAFPAQVCSFQRSFAQQKLDDPKSIRVGYGHIRRGSPHMVIITVESSNLSPSEAIRSQKEAFMVAHADAVVAELVAGSSLALFRDWHFAVFDYSGFVGDFPPSMRHQPRRLLYAARTYGGNTLVLESSPFYPDFEPVFFPAADKLVGDLFPDRQ